jgi:hypothetical protein
MTELRIALGLVCVLAAIIFGGAQHYATAFARSHVIKLFDDLQQAGAIDMAKAASVANLPANAERFALADDYLLGNGHAMRPMSMIGVAQSVLLIAAGITLLFTSLGKSNREHEPSSQLT